ncbi:hypothetical protein GCM10025738_09410 [Microbacterium fluvii]
MITPTIVSTPPERRNSDLSLGRPTARCRAGSECVPAAAARSAAAAARAETAWTGRSTVAAARRSADRESRPAPRTEVVPITDYLVILEVRVPVLEASVELPE